MKNELHKKGFSVFVLIACIIGVIGIIGAELLAAEEDEESGQLALEARFRGEIDGLNSKAETAAQEVNEFIGNEIKKAELRKKLRYREELGYIPKGDLLSEDELSVFEVERQQKLDEIRSQFNREINNVEVQGLAAAQAQQVEQKPKPVSPEIYGTVTGIVLYEARGAALVAGKVVRTNDSIRDVKITRILPGYVEFEKQGKRWVQEVGQSPPQGVWEQKKEKESPKK